MNNPQCLLNIHSVTLPIYYPPLPVQFSILHPCFLKVARTKYPGGHSLFIKLNALQNAVDFCALLSLALVRHWIPMDSHLPEI